MKISTTLFLAIIALLTLFGCNTDIDDATLNNSRIINDDGGAYAAIEPYYICTPLIAGQNTTVGEVCYSIIELEEPTLVVSYTTFETWTLNETHLWVGDDLTTIPLTNSNNPIIGQFPYSNDTSGKVVHTYTIPLSQITATICDATFYIAAHAVVEHYTLGGGIESETAWGDGVSINDQASWATYFSHTIDCPEEEEPIATIANYETAFAFNQSTSTCFLSIDQDHDGRSDFNRWGWTNQLKTSGTYHFTLYAGAGQCDINKGEVAGKLTLHYDATFKTLTANYSTNEGFYFSEIHLYIGDTMVPINPNGMTSVAPGQYTIVTTKVDEHFNTYTLQNVSGNGIHIIAHAVVFNYIPNS